MSGVHRISVDPAIMVGKPTVAGTRIPVTTVLGHLAQNLDIDDLFAAFPALSPDDVRAVLAYARELAAAEWRRTRPHTEV